MKSYLKAGAPILFTVIMLGILGGWKLFLIMAPLFLIGAPCMAYLLKLQEEGIKEIKDKKK